MPQRASGPVSSAGAAPASARTPNENAPSSAWPSSVETVCQSTRYAPVASSRDGVMTSRLPSGRTLAATSAPPSTARSVARASRPFSGSVNTSTTRPGERSSRCPGAGSEPT